jgi:hypothetical protein
MYRQLRRPAPTTTPVGVLASQTTRKPEQHHHHLRVVQGHLCCHRLAPMYRRSRPAPPSLILSGALASLTARRLGRCRHHLPQAAPEGRLSCHNPAPMCRRLTALRSIPNTAAGAMATARKANQSVQSKAPFPAIAAAWVRSRASRLSRSQLFRLHRR